MRRARGRGGGNCPVKQCRAAAVAALCGAGHIAGCVSGVWLCDSPCSCWSRWMLCVGACELAARVLLVRPRWCTFGTGQSAYSTLAEGVATCKTLEPSPVVVQLFTSPSPPKLPQKTSPKRRLLSLVPVTLG